MTQREAKRLACRGASHILFNQDEVAEWLTQDEDGNELSEADQRRMSKAILELSDELWIRGTRTSSDTGDQAQ